MRSRNRVRCRCSSVFLANGGARALRGSHRRPGSFEERTSIGTDDAAWRTRNLQRGKAACFLPAMIGKKRRAEERAERSVNVPRLIPHADDDISPRFLRTVAEGLYPERNDVIVFRSLSQVQIYRHFLARVRAPIWHRHVVLVRDDLST